MGSPKPDLSGVCHSQSLIVYILIIACFGIHFKKRLKAHHSLYLKPYFMHWRGGYFPAFGLKIWKNEKVNTASELSGLKPLH